MIIKTEADWFAEYEVQHVEFCMSRGLIPMSFDSWVAMIWENMATAAK